MWVVRKIHRYIAQCNRSAQAGLPAGEAAGWQATFWPTV